MKDLPGVNGTEFKIMLYHVGTDLWPEKDTLVEVVSIPTKHRYQWYWKILHYLTFTLFFEEYYTYEVKILKDESNNLLP